MDKKDLDKEDERGKDSRRRKKPERNWVDWLTGFLIYVGVIVKAQPWREQSASLSSPSSSTECHPLT